MAYHTNNHGEIECPDCHGLGCEPECGRVQVCLARPNCSNPATRISKHESVQLPVCDACEAIWDAEVKPC